jgi:hypothetical protein
VAGIDRSLAGINHDLALPDVVEATIGQRRVPSASRRDRQVVSQVTRSHLVDELASVLLGPANAEVERLMREDLTMGDLTACELLALLAILRAAWECKQAQQNPPVPLGLARSGKRRRR